MSTPDLLDTPGPAIERDRWNRPLVTPPGGGKRKPYTRCTTFVGVLDDRYALELWHKRLTALGLADRPDLLLSVTAHRDDKKQLNTITEQAVEAAQASAAATTGTAQHTLTERLDRHLELPLIPEAYRADLDAYRDATAALEPVLIEQFTVLDELEIGGTPDRVVRYRGEQATHADVNHGFIADVKTGSIDYGAMKIAMQLSVYARSVPYDPATGTRTPYPVDVDTRWGIVIHLPAGRGECTLHWVDLEAGWAAVQTAAEVRGWRRHKPWMKPFSDSEAEASPTTLVDAPSSDFPAQIAACVTVAGLRDIYRQAAAVGEYTTELHAACLARKAELNGGNP